MSAKECVKEAEIVALKTRQETMANDIKEIKETQIRIFDKLDEFKSAITSSVTAEVSKMRNYADDTFATKADHKTNVERIDEIESTHKKTLIAIITILGSSVLWLIGVLWSNLDKIIAR